MKESPGGMQPSLLDTAGRRRDSPPPTCTLQRWGGDNPVLPISCTAPPPHPTVHLLPPLQGPPKPALLWHQLVRRIIRVWREARAECSSGGGRRQRGGAAMQSHGNAAASFPPSLPPREGGGGPAEIPCPGVSPRLGPLAPDEKASSAGKPSGNPCPRAGWRSEGERGKPCA